MQKPMHDQSGPIICKVYLSFGINRETNGEKRDESGELVKNSRNEWRDETKKWYRSESGVWGSAV
jgi:hypothetical protein